MVLGGRMAPRKLPVYVAAQFAGALLAGLAVYALFAPSIAGYEAAHHILRGSAQSVQTARMFGEYYQLPGGRAVVSLPLAVGAEAFGTEYFRLVHGTPAGPFDESGRETDLFAGI
jgi:glycerol uptake facilitator protein